MIWWILGSLAVIGAIAYIVVIQSRKTQESLDAVMHPIYPEIAVDMAVKEGDFSSKPTVINFTRTPSHQMPHHVDRRGVRWVNPQGNTVVGMDPGFVDPMDMIILGDAILNSSSDPGYQPDDSPVYVAPESSSAPEPVESSHSWGESSHSSSSWGESSSSSSYGDSSSSSSDCGGGSDGGGGDD
jgi:uncharacterized membrane protein YgcG